MLRTALLLLATLLLAPPVWADDAPTGRPPRGRHLDLALDRYKHDFGFVTQGSVHKATFTLTNTSTRTVTDIRARGECGCNVMNIEKPALAPGGTCFFEVEFNTHTLGGPLTKRVRIVSSEHGRGEIVLELSIRIQKGLVVQPSGVNFRTIEEGTRPTKPFYLRRYEGQSTPFRITSVVIPGYEDTFAATVRPWQDPKDPRWQGWQVDVRILKALPRGSFSAEIRVRTTDKARPELTLALNGNVAGKLWVQNRFFSFGSVAPDQVPTKRSSVKIKPRATGVALKSPRAVSKLGKVLVEVMPDPYMAKQGMWKLVARIAPGTSPGSLADEVITLHTGVPGEETVVFEVRGQVKGGGGSRDGR